MVLLSRKFPRIAEAIELLWGDRALDGYLHKLIVADREDRAGFPEDVHTALLKLYNQHAQQFKFLSAEDAWAEEDRINRMKGRPPVRR